MAGRSAPNARTRRRSGGRSSRRSPRTEARCPPLSDRLIYLEEWASFETLAARWRDNRRDNVDEKTLKEILSLHAKWLDGLPSGKRANLTRADLTEANLTESDLTDADLTEADLTEADLTRANLTDANLTRADLTQAGLGVFPALYILKLQPPGTRLRAWKFVLANGDSSFRSSPGSKITYKVGDTYSVVEVDGDERRMCSPGLSIATLPWCLLNSCHINDVFMEVEYLAEDIVAIPFATDGKFRVRALTVIRALNRQDAEIEARRHLATSCSNSHRI
jgi:hypothetical protein